MNLDAAHAVLAQREMRQARTRSMLDSLLPQQRAAIVDPVRLKALFCTRRAGKSYTLGIYLFLTALAYPGCSCLYLGLTRSSSHGIMNKDILRVINARFGIGAVWKESQSRWELPNGSHITLRGADSNSYEISKIVGQKYRLAILDEASKYRYVVRDMVYGALLPAMGDDLGTIVLSGTPSNITLGLFYDVTTGAEHGWKTHSWSWRDNAFKVANITQVHDDAVAQNPGIVGTPLYRQEWLGEWVVDQSALCYRFREDLNTAEKLPKPTGEYTYILGIDLGYTDPTALVVGAYHPNDPALYIVHAHKASGLIISDVAALIRSLWQMPSAGCFGPYPFAAMVADAASLQGVEEMKQKHRLPLEAAVKPGKRGVIEVMNSDMETGRVKVLPAAMSITEEWASLIWDEKKLRGVPRRWEEDSRFANHLADAALYMWRKARNYDAVDEAPTPPAPGTVEYEELRFQREWTKVNRFKAEPMATLYDEMPEWLQEGRDV